MPNQKCPGTAWARNGHRMSTKQKATRLGGFRWVMNPMRHNGSAGFRPAKIVVNQRLRAIAAGRPGCSFHPFLPLAAGQPTERASRTVLANRPLGQLMGLDGPAQLARSGMIAQCAGWTRGPSCLRRLWANPSSTHDLPLRRRFGDVCACVDGSLPQCGHLRVLLPELAGARLQTRAGVSLPKLRLAAALRCTGHLLHQQRMSHDEVGACRTARRRAE
jgi:hypothetical protein